MRSPKQLSFDDHRLHSGRGGPRIGAGRPPSSPNPPVYHVRRPTVPGSCPSHVTVRVMRGLPSLRSRRFLRELRSSLHRACERTGFRLVHYSVQRNHLHLIVEASGKEALGRGMKSIAARIARAANRAFRRRGPVLYGRYHLRALRTPREVRNALAYVLLNARKHWRQRYGAPPPVRIDEASSARWFDGWRASARAPLAELRAPPAIPDVAPARTWLLRVGWRRHGLIDPGEVPRGSGDARRR